MRSIFKAGFFIFVINIALYSSAAHAIEVPDISQMILNISKTVPNLMQLVTAFAYVMGFWMVIKGVMALKQYGESRTMMSSQHDLKGPLLYLFVGAAMIWLPSSVEAGLTTFWTDPTPYAYQTETNDSWLQLIQAIFLVVQLIGTIAFIRGLVILTHLGSQAQPGTFGRALTHIIGGVFLINIYGFIQTIFATFALGQI